MNPENLQIIQQLTKQVSDLEGLVQNLGKQLNQEISRRTDPKNIPPHSHKVDRINTKDLIGGFPIVSSTPTGVAEEGTIKIYDNGVTRKLYVKTGQAWWSSTLT